MCKYQESTPSVLTLVMKVNNFIVENQISSLHLSILRSFIHRSTIRKGEENISKAYKIFGIPMFSNCIHKQIKWTPSQSQNSHFHADIAIISRDIQLWSLLPSNCSTNTRSKYRKFFSSLQLVQCDQIEITAMPSGQKRVSIKSKVFEMLFLSRK